MTKEQLEQFTPKERIMLELMMEISSRLRTLADVMDKAIGE